jgi:hypothetical protein
MSTVAHRTLPCGDSAACKGVPRSLSCFVVNAVEVWSSSTVPAQRDHLSLTHRLGILYKG